MRLGLSATLRRSEEALRATKQVAQKFDELSAVRGFLQFNPKVKIAAVYSRPPSPDRRVPQGPALGQETRIGLQALQLMALHIGDQ